MKKILVFGVCFVFLVGLWACTGDQNANQENNEPASPTSINTPFPPTETPIPPTATTEPSPTPFIPVEMSWEGEWRNLTYGSSGPIEMTCVTQADSTATCEVDLGGYVFGAVDPEPFSFTAALSGITDAQFSLEEDPIFGDVTATVSLAEGIHMVAENIPISGIERMEILGNFAPVEGAAFAFGFEGEYVVTFTGGGTANGVLELLPVIE